MATREPLEAHWVGPVDCRRWLDADEQRLRIGKPGVWAGLVRDRAVSLGVAMQPHAEWERRWASRGLPILRRSSGGTGLLHLPGDLLWSVVLPRSEFARLGGSTRSYTPLGAALGASLGSLGVPSQWDAALALSDRFCLFGPRGEVLSSGGRAIGGAAQHVTARTVLHHGVVSASVDRPAIAELFHVPLELLEERLGSLQELRRHLSMESVGQELLRLAGRPDYP